MSLPAGAKIDTTAGVILDAGGGSIPVKTSMVLQVGAPPIFVVEAGALTIQDVTVEGDGPLAFVAAGQVTISGRISVRAHAGAPGPGGRTDCSAAPHTQRNDCICGICSFGTGGGGNNFVGGSGGSLDITSARNGGAQLTSFTPLAGGCAAGDLFTPAAALLNHGGAGGGAVQIVSAQSVSFSDAGMIDAGGGGGAFVTGGGAGGTIIVEAPVVSMAGPSAGVVANGGAGAGCSVAGPDATFNNDVAIAPSNCVIYFGGNGGTSNALPGDACIFNLNCTHQPDVI